MSLKLWAALLLVVAVVVSAAYLVGHSNGRNAGDLACATAHSNDAANYQAKTTQAEANAREAQQAADAKQLADTTRLLNQAQQAALVAQQTADLAKQKNDALTANLARLQHEDATVQKWTDHCLPASLLASLHPGIDPKAYPSNCGAAGRGHQGAISTNTGQPAAGH